jgi:hypothetical protein
LDIEQYRQQTAEACHTARRLCRLAKQTCQTSLQLCEQSLVAQETAQAMVRLCRLAWERRDADKRSPRSIPFTMAEPLRR